MSYDEKRKKRKEKERQDKDPTRLKSQINKGEFHEKRKG